jgi:hypothetical protein
MLPSSPPVGQIATTPSAPTKRLRPLLSSRTGVDPNANRD